MNLRGCLSVSVSEWACIMFCRPSWMCTYQDVRGESRNHFLSNKVCLNKIALGKPCGEDHELKPTSRVNALRAGKMAPPTGSCAGSSTYSRVTCMMEPSDSSNKLFSL